MNKLTIVFTDAERFGLTQLVQREMRPPKDMLRWLLHQELERRGLLPDRQKDSALAIGRRAG